MKTMFVTDSDTPLFFTEDMKCSGNKNSLKKSLIILVLIFAAASAYIIISSIKAGEPPTGKMFFFTVMFAVMTAELILKSKGSTDNNYNVFYFYENCYVNIDRLSKTTIPYEMAVKAVETKDSFVIYFERFKGHVIPKDAVSNGTPDDLSRFLSLKIKNYKYNYKNN